MAKCSDQWQYQLFGKILVNGNVNGNNCRTPIFNGNINVNFFQFPKAMAISMSIFFWFQYQCQWQFQYFLPEISMAMSMTIF
jgi:hypothetical protein